MRRLVRLPLGRHRPSGRRKSATYYYFALCRDDGTDQVIHDLLRCRAREKAGRAEDPTAVVLDTQSIRAATHVPAATTGKDAAKKVPGRNRGLAVDALGMIIAVVVTAASVTDNAIGVRLLDNVVTHTPTVVKAWVDAGFEDDVQIHGTVNGIDVEQGKRSDPTAGFVPVARSRPGCCPPPREVAIGAAEKLVNSRDRAHVFGI
ncbi:Transposase DDE domain-containing protein [Micromonospora inyonensis]|uniref:Transposase DDE domain-containing protein n=1 Tax=Micromonospora inyonensis TaxID=47866 RepID=A0A1C6R7Y9_9ACTN|nr:transposase [Micromonospora inyonensis]SCL13160.1 Transposase DDE domain-containing protein [Micromonospora inyonensis]